MEVRFHRDDISRNPEQMRLGEGFVRKSGLFLDDFATVDLKLILSQDPLSPPELGYYSRC